MRVWACCYAAFRPILDATAVRGDAPCTADPVFSDHVFARQEFERLTDAQWQRMCLRGQHHKLRPAWTSSFLR